MGLTKKTLPISARTAIARNLDRLPEGVIRDNFANIITVNGLGMVATGVAIGGKTGMALRVVGELHDDWDGDTSRYLKTTGRKGAFIDAGADKVKVLLEMIKLFKSSAQLPEGERNIRRLALGFITTKHVVNGTLNTIATARGLLAETSTAGRVNMWVDGITMGAFGISDELKNPKARLAVATIGYTGAVVGVPVGLYTVAGYVRDTIVNPQPLEIVELETGILEDIPELL